MSTAKRTNTSKNNKTNDNNIISSGGSATAEAFRHPRWVCWY